MRHRNLALAAAGALVLVMAGAVALLPVPYVVLTPGPVFNTLGDAAGKPVITVTGAPTYPTQGQLDATTVYEMGGPGRRLGLVTAFRAWLDKASEVVPEKLLYPPDQTSQESQQQGVQQMKFSQQDAVVAALRYLHKPVREVVQVQSVINGAPADGVLKPADRIVRVDGKPVTGPVQVRNLISSRKPGESVQLGILRGNIPMQKVVKTEADPQDPSRAIIGIIPGVGYVSPVKVDIQLANVAGPSAGLMFTLGIIDKLTPGPIAGDAHVAGTGTISTRGRVGPIGGINQKLFGARNDGADFFLVPASNCGQAVRNEPAGLQLIKVSRLDDAVKALGQIEAGQADLLPTCK